MPRIKIDLEVIPCPSDSSQIEAFTADGYEAMGSYDLHCGGCGTRLLKGAERTTYPAYVANFPLHIIQCPCRLCNLLPLTL